MERRNVSSGAPWERRYSYSRAVRLGRHVFISGTTGIGPDGRPVSENPGAQAARALEIAEAALIRVGAHLADVVRTRIYVTDIAYAGDVGRVHGRRFRSIRPSSTLVEVGALIDPGIKVEIEMEAVLPLPPRSARRGGQHRRKPSGLRSNRG